MRALFPSTSPGGVGGGAYIRRGDVTEGFLRYEFVGLIFGGAYFRNFMVFFPHISFYLILIAVHRFFHFGVREFDFSLILFLCSLWS